MRGPTTPTAPCTTRPGCRRRHSGWGRSNMDRREFLSAFAATAAAGAAVAKPEAAQKPNVLFVLADQWRFSAFSHATDPLVRTPAMDKLAAEGARFTRMHAANPVCTPNRSCILTGRFAHQ